MNACSQGLIASSEKCANCEASIHRRRPHRLLNDAAAARLDGQGRVGFGVGLLCMTNVSGGGDASRRTDSIALAKRWAFKHCSIFRTS
jgi:L-aminopeptidase/D-esterase-like protein